MHSAHLLEHTNTQEKYISNQDTTKFQLYGEDKKVSKLDL
jgi:hypothetical protein